MRVLAIDPGRQKCGLAIVERHAVLERAVIPTGRLAETLAAWTARHALDRILLGDRTGAKDLRRQLATLFPQIPVVLVAEEGTTLQARRRYFQDHPPRGWRRFIPQSVQLPPDPYDDYVAVLLAERYFATVC